MWPAKWIHDDVELQALLARWRGTRVQIWEYSVSHSRLLIRMIWEKSSSGRIADAYLLCRGCRNWQSKTGWLDSNINVKREVGADEPVRVVSDGDRLNVVCISVLAFENEAGVFPFIHLVDELRGLPPLKNQVNFTPCFEYIFVRVNGQTPEEIAREIKRVVDISIPLGANIFNVLGSLIVVDFNSFLHGSDLRGKRVVLVEKLNGELSGKFKIVHGAAKGQDGKYDAMLSKLDHLEFGQIEEF